MSNLSKSRRAATSVLADTQELLVGHAPIGGNMTSSLSPDDVEPGHCRAIASLLRRARPVVAKYTEGDPNWEGATHSQLAAERVTAQLVAGEPFEIALSQAISIAQLYVFAILQHLDAPTFSASPISRCDRPSARSLRAMSSRAGEITVGRPPLWPRATAAASPAIVRSRMSSRSISPRAPIK